MGSSAGRPPAHLAARGHSLLPAGWEHARAGDLGMLMYALMPSHPKLVLLPPSHPLVPCTPKRAGCLSAGCWVVASPLCDSSGPGQGRAFNRRLLSLAPGTEMPPPTPATCRAQPPHTPHGSWLPRLGWTPFHGAHHRSWNIIGPSWGRGRESLSTTSLLGWRWQQRILQGPRCCRDVSPHLAQAGGFSWLHAQVHRVAAAWPRSAQGPLATGLVCQGCFETHKRFPPCESQSRACSCSQPALGNHQLGVIIRF